MTVSSDSPAPTPSPVLLQPSSSTSPLQVLVVFLIALLMGGLAFFHALNSPITLQDEPFVGQNSLLLTAEGLERMWRGIWPTHERYPLPTYQPMTYTTFWIDRAIWGELPPPTTDGRGTLPRGMHLTNLFIHSVSVALLFGLLKKLRVPGAMLAALLFALHPIHVQTLAWIFARGYLLSMMFGLMATYPFLKWAGVGNREATLSEDMLGESLPKKGLAAVFQLPQEPWKQLAIAGVLFLAAVGSHAAAVCFPLAWLALIWWKKQHVPSGVSLASGAFLLPAIVAVGLWVNMGLDRAGVYADRYDFAQGSTAQEAFARLGVAGAALAKYLQLILVPFNLMPDHARWDASGNIKWVGIIVWLGVISGGVMLTMSLRKWTWAKHVLGAMLVGVALFVPAIFLLDVPATISGQVVERSAYFGVAWAVTIFAAVASTLAMKSKEFAGPSAGLAAVLVAACVGGTFWHAKKYQSEGAAWKFAIERNPQSWLAYAQGAGFQELRAKRDALAFETYSRMLKMFPKDPHGSLAIARLQARGQQTQVALTILDGLTKALPEFSDAQVLKGELLQQAGELNAAFDAFEAARQADPRNSTARLRQAQLFLDAAANALAQGNREEVGKNLALGMAVTEESLAVNPLDADALNMLGTLHYNNNQRSDALVAWEKARTVVPNDPVLANNLATLFIKAEQFEEAEAELTRALSLSPQFAEALSNKGRLQLILDKKDEARRYFQQALAINPNLPSARQGLMELDAPSTRPTTNAAE
jgi:protein O-mannosyl-transferase